VFPEGCEEGLGTEYASCGQVCRTCGRIAATAAQSKLGNSVRVMLKAYAELRTPEAVSLEGRAISRTEVSFLLIKALRTDVKSTFCNLT